jgi:hypothetical protein
MLNGLVVAPRKSLKQYTQILVDELCDITTETDLVNEIEAVLDQLTIIDHVGLSQAAVMEPFMRDMLHQSFGTKDTDFHDTTRLGSRIRELQKTARATHVAVSTHHSYSSDS